MKKLYDKWMHQLFANASEVVEGDKIVYLYRVISQQASTTGAVIAYTTENSMSISMDADSTSTKDGMIRSPGNAEVEISASSIFKKGDTLIKTLRNAMLNKKVIEIWRANLDDPVSTSAGNQKFHGTYYQGFLTSFEEASNSGEHVEYSLTFGVNGSGVDGQVTVTASQQAEALYAFTDTVIQTPGVTITPDTLSIPVGEYGVLQASVVPGDATITWTSSDDTKATVSNGVVSAVAAGSVTITAKITVDGTDFTDTCAVTVTAQSA